MPSRVVDAVSGRVVPDVDWAARAAAAERAVVRRHLRRLGGIVPGTRIGRVRWPRLPPVKPWPWHYWWQAHLLDCLVDAQLRSPRPERADAIAAVARTVRLRNLGSWTNDYYDDVAWFGLAVQRAGTLARRSARPALGAITLQLRDGWSADGGGGIWWRRGDDFKNAPANGPAAILLARGGHVGLAASIADWMHDTLLRSRDRADPRRRARAAGRRGARGRGHARTPTARASTWGPAWRWRRSTAPRSAALGGPGRGAARRGGTHVVGSDGVVPGYDDGGDGGLFNGILARYLADAALRRPELAPGGRAGRARERGSGLGGPAGGRRRSGVRPGLAPPGPRTPPGPGGGGPVGAALGVDAAGGRGGRPARRLTRDQVLGRPASRWAGSGAGGRARKASSGCGASSSIGRRISCRKR